MYNGVLNIYKEKGYTSFDVVARLRGILKQKKIGHTGTLDPDAVGVLPVCLGKATSLCDILTDKVKIYEGELILGIETDTYDISGTVTSSIIPELNNCIVKEKISDIKNELKLILSNRIKSYEEIDTAVQSFKGKYMQYPPKYSAIKVNGKKLYEYARENIEVKINPREISIYSVDILDIDLPIIKLRIECSKGTYIRSLCKDIGDRLSIPACMGNLTRVKSGEFELKDSIKLSELGDMSEEEVNSKLINIESFFEEFEPYTVLEEDEKLLKNGNKMLINGVSGKKIRMYDSRNNFIAIYEKDGYYYKPYKMFL